MEQTHSKLKYPTLSQRFYENRYVWISFAASALVMLLVYICFELIPFGGRTILRMDLYHPVSYTHLTLPTICSV